MSADAEIREAIIEAVARAKQPTTVATKLLAWFDAVASGSESLVDRESVRRHLDLVLQAMPNTYSTAPPERVQSGRRDRDLSDAEEL
jgi:hypothetical protein